jgi:aryl-alcohol dehydrogenase-like predicted oxidoreductase
VGQAIKTIHVALEHGINFIDTAPVYGGGLAEELVGQAIKGQRDRVVIATKLGAYLEMSDHSTFLKPLSIREQLESSLRRLGVDYVDLYQIHWPDPDVPFDDTVAELEKLKTEGKFRYLGVSNFSLSQLNDIRRTTDIVSYQAHYSLLKRDIEADILPYCRENKLSVLGYGTLAAGILAGKYSELPQFKEGDRRNTFYNFFYEPFWSKAQKLVDLLRTLAAEHHKSVAQVAINWSIQQPGITAALVGTKTPAQAVSDAEAGSWSLSREELDLIEAEYNRIF